MGRLGFLVITASFVLGIGGLFGCGGEDGGDRNWSVQNGTLALTETLRVTEGNDFFFGEIHDVAVRDDGRIYVADGKAGNVKVLSPEGTLLDTIGERGNGPGKFRRAPTQVTLARGDSLYVLDSYTGHVTIFGPDHASARSFSVRTDSGNVLKLFVPEQRSGFAVHYSSDPVPGESNRHPVRRLDPAGRAGDTLFTTPPPEMHFENTNEGTQRAGIPFARFPRFSSGSKGTIHFAWSDSLGVRGYSYEGKQVQTVDVPFESVSVTEEDWNRKMETREWRLSSDQLREKSPSTKPAFEYFLVDDEGRYWFGRPTADPDSLSWWGGTPTQKRVVTTTLPKEVFLITVRNGHAYGRTTTEGGAPALVRYQIDVQV